MFRHLWIGVGLLLVLLIAGLLLTTFVDHTCIPISQLLEQAGNVSEQGDWETASMLVHSAQIQWEENWNRIATLADHSPMDEIDGLFAQTMAYAKGVSAVDLTAYCRRLASLIRAVSEAHSLTWWNLI